MLLWLAVAAFGIPLIYVIIDNKRRKQDLEKQLEIVQKKIAIKEQSLYNEKLETGASVEGGEQDGE